MKILRWLILLGVVFGWGITLGSNPDMVKQTLRDLSEKS